MIVIPLNDKRKSLTLPEEGREMNLGRRRSSILLQVDLARATSSRFSTSENKDASKGKTTNYSMYSSIIFLVVCVVLILIGTHVIPGATMPGIEAYNAVHIFSNVLCHFVAVDVGFVCFNLHRIIIAVKVSKNGITLNELNSHELTTKIPGARLRQLMVICSLALVVVMSFMTVNFAWKPVPTIVATDFCISPVYDVKPKFIDDVGPFMIGTSEFTLIQHHGLPLADGIAGGWAGQPLVHPASEFIIEGDGLGYVMSTECFEEYSAADGINGTALTMTESFLHGDNTAIDGRVIIQIPAGSIISPFDTGNGVKFECTFAIRFGQAKIKFAFSSDSWGHMLEKSIQSFAVGDLSVTNENSKDVSSRELSDILQG